MKTIYTKTGDQGMTSLLGGSRVEKTDLKVECYGTLDELNSALGIAYASLVCTDIKPALYFIQEQLFTLSAEIASDERGKDYLTKRITNEDVKTLEQVTDRFMGMVGPQKTFIIPGANISSAYLHLARTIARRAERNMLKLHNLSALPSTHLVYMNRLSDTLFSMARVEAEINNIKAR